MADLPWNCWEITYNKNLDMQYISVTYLRIAETPRKFRARLGQRAVFVGRMAVKPLLGRRKQPAIDLAAERARGPARPVRRQQRGRQQRVAQHDAAVMVDHKDSGGEGLGIRQPLAATDPTSQRLEGFHEFLIGICGALERPA